MSKNNLEEFCKRHSIRILDSSKRAYRHNGLSNQFFKYSDNYNILDRVVVCDTEPLHTVEISDTSINRLADFESQVFNHMDQHGHRNLFLTIMEQKENEKMLIAKYPAVKKAFEHYSLLLHMAQAGEL